MFSSQKWTWKKMNFSKHFHFLLVQEVSEVWGQANLLSEWGIIKGNAELVEEELPKEPIFWSHQSLDVWQIVGCRPNHQMANGFGSVARVKDHLFFCGNELDSDKHSHQAHIAPGWGCTGDCQIGTLGPANWFGCIQCPRLCPPENITTFAKHKNTHFAGNWPGWLDQTQNRLKRFPRPVDESVECGEKGIAPIERMFAVFKTFQRDFPSLCKHWHRIPVPVGWAPLTVQTAYRNHALLLGKEVQFPMNAKIKSNLPIQFKLCWLNVNSSNFILLLGQKVFHAAFYLYIKSPLYKCHWKAYGHQTAGECQWEDAVQSGQIQSATFVDDIKGVLANELGTVQKQEMAFRLGTAHPNHILGQTESLNGWQSAEGCRVAERPE